MWRDTSCRPPLTGLPAALPGWRSLRLFVLRDSCWSKDILTLTPHNLLVPSLLWGSSWCSHTSLSILSTAAAADSQPVLSCSRSHTHTHTEKVRHDVIAHLSCRAWIYLRADIWRAGLRGAWAHPESPIMQEIYGPPRDSGVLMIELRVKMNKTFNIAGCKSHGAASNDDKCPVTETHKNAEQP